MKKKEDKTQCSGLNEVIGGGRHCGYTHHLLPGHISMLAQTNRDKRSHTSAPEVSSGSSGQPKCMSVGGAAENTPTLPPHPSVMEEGPTVPVAGAVTNNHFWKQLSEKNTIANYIVKFFLYYTIVA